MLLDTTSSPSCARRLTAASTHRRIVGSEQNPDSRYLSAVTLFEIERGVLRMSAAMAKQAQFRRWLETQILQAFKGRILPFDLASHALRPAHVPDSKARARSR